MAPVSLRDVALRLAACYTVIGLATAFRALHVTNRLLDPDGWTRESENFKIAANHYGTGKAWAILTTAYFFLVWATWPAWMGLWTVRAPRR